LFINDIGLDGDSFNWDRLVKSADEDPVLKTADRRIGSISSGPTTKLWDDLELRYKLGGFGFLEHDVNTPETKLRW
jgi:hypothetical protein